MDEKDIEIAKLKEELAKLKGEEKKVINNQEEENTSDKQKVFLNKEMFRQLANTSKKEQKIVSEQKEKAPMTPEFAALQQSQNKAGMVHINDENNVPLSSRYYEAALKEIKESGRESFFDY